MVNILNINKIKTKTDKEHLLRLSWCILSTMKTMICIVFVVV